MEKLIPKFEMPEKYLSPQAVLALIHTANMEPATQVFRATSAEDSEEEETENHLTGQVS